MRGVPAGLPSPQVAPQPAEEASVSLFSLFIYTVPFLAVLTVIVFFHEMGHFLMGRLFGVKIDAFSLGFGPELAHYVDRRGTRWRLALLPLGGYVKFHGDADGTSMTRTAATATMAPDVLSKTLLAQSVWKRAAVVAAGPIANFIIAIAIFSAMFYVEGRLLHAPQIGAVQQNSAAAAAGFAPGDLITAVNGAPLESFEDMQRIVQTGDGGPMTLAIVRDGRAMTLAAQPRRQTVNTLFGPLTTNILGVEADRSPANVRNVSLGPLQSLALGAADTWSVVEGTGHFLKELVAGRESTEQLSGPIRIAEVSGQVAKLGIGPLLRFVAILSISIGLLNLLPIPILDGGFLMFFAVEAIRGKALQERTMEVGFRIGLTFVAALSLFVAWNDISRHFPQRSGAPGAGDVRGK